MKKDLLIFIISFLTMSFNSVKLSSPPPPPWDPGDLETEGGFGGTIELRISEPTVVIKIINQTDCDFDLEIGTRGMDGQGGDLIGVGTFFLPGGGPTQNVTSTNILTGWSFTDLSGNPVSSVTYYDLNYAGLKLTTGGWSQTIWPYQNGISISNSGESAPCDCFKVNFFYAFGYLNVVISRPTPPCP